MGKKRPSFWKVLKGLAVLRRPYSIVGRCFWCERSLLFEEASRDHVVPKCLKGTRTVLCCRPCNQDRAAISSLASVLRKWARKAEQESKSLYEARSNLIRSRDDMLPTLLNYRELVEAKLAGQEQRECLEEIDLVLNYGRRGSAGTAEG